MTAPNKNVYLISLKDSQDRMQAYVVVATTKILAESVACTLAGVADGTETYSSVFQGKVNGEGA
jgi:hypothetical protein